MKSIRLPPQYWALATFFIPIAYGIWLLIGVAGVANSTQAETAVRGGATRRGYAETLGTRE